MAVVHRIGGAIKRCGPRSCIVPRSIRAGEHMFGYAATMSDPYFAQRAVLGALLTAHPRLLGVDELVSQLTDVPRAREAVRVLVDDGLLTRLGDRVGVSRAVVRFHALAPLSRAAEPG
jgi:hypothetical protein